MKPTTPEALLRLVADIKAGLDGDTTAAAHVQEALGGGSWGDLVQVIIALADASTLPPATGRRLPSDPSTLTTLECRAAADAYEHGDLSLPTLVGSIEFYRHRMTLTPAPTGKQQRPGARGSHRGYLQAVNERALTIRRETQHQEVGAASA